MSGRDESSTSPLSGLRVLVAEDQFLIALSIERALAQAGCEIVGPVGRAGDAADIARTEALDGAILDLDLAGETAAPVAQQLLNEGVPVVFATAARAEELPPRLRGLPRVEKPFELGSLVALAAAAFRRQRTSPA